MVQLGASLAGNDSSDDSSTSSTSGGSGGGAFDFDSDMTSSWNAPGRSVRRKEANDGGRFGQ
jgi:hypothetical protein